MAVLQFARERGCPWDSLTTAYAQVGKHQGRWCRMKPVFASME